MKFDFLQVLIPFEYQLLRAFYKESNRWGNRVHISVNQRYKFKGEQVKQGNPICGVYEGRIYNPNLTLWTPRPGQKFALCQNCVIKLLLENELKIYPADIAKRIAELKSIKSKKKNSSLI